MRHLHQRLYVSSQANDQGLGLGAINFCVKALVEKSLFNMQNLIRHKYKVRCAYLLLSAEGAEKSALTAEFLKRKVPEYETLQVGIEFLKAEMNSVKGGPL